VLTGSRKYKGILTAVPTDSIIVNQQSIAITQIKAIKFRSKKRLKNAIITSASAPASFGAGILFFFISWDSGSNVAEVLSGASFLYVPVAVIIAPILFTKKKMKVKKWSLEVVD
jgi:hypothetical protein